LLERAQRAGGALLGRAGNARQRLVGEERIFDAGEAREERGPGRRRGQRGGERTLERLASATDEPGAQRGDAPGDPQPIRALVLLAARRVPHRAREEQRRADEAARVLRLADIDRALGERASEEPEAGAQRFQRGLALALGGRRPRSRERAGLAVEPPEDRLVPAHLPGQSIRLTTSCIAASVVGSSESGWTTAASHASRGVRPATTSRPAATSKRVLTVSARPSSLSDRILRAIATMRLAVLTSRPLSAATISASTAGSG